VMGIAVDVEEQVRGLELQRSEGRRIRKRLAASPESGSAASVWRLAQPALPKDPAALTF
jgi:hypothetical protein